MKTLAFAALLLASQAVLAMPHDQPTREVYETGTLQVQVYRSPGLASEDYWTENARKVESILVCKNGKAVKTFTNVHEIGGSIIGTAKADGVALTVSQGYIVSLDLGKTHIDSKAITYNADESGINGFEIDSNKFGSCAKKTDKVDL